MRCLACNCILSDFEATRKYSTNNEYVDLCNECFKYSSEPVIVREDLQTTEDFFDDCLDNYDEEELK